MYFQRLGLKNYFLESNTIKYTSALLSHLSKRRLTQIKLTLVFGILNSFVESISVASIYPFLTAITNQEKLWYIYLVNKTLVFSITFS